MATATIDDRPFVPVVDPEDTDPFASFDVEEALKAAEDDPFGDGPTQPKREKKGCKPYNPGTPGEVRFLGNGQYEVYSWRGKGNYTVDLKAGTCTCPDFTKRNRACKHQAQAREEAYHSALRTARQLTEEELLEQVHRTDLRPEILQAAKDILSYRYL